MLWLCGFPRQALLLPPVLPNACSVTWPTFSLCSWLAAAFQLMNYAIYRTCLQLSICPWFSFRIMTIFKNKNQKHGHVLGQAYFLCTPSCSCDLHLYVYSFICFLNCSSSSWLWTGLGLAKGGSHPMSGLMQRDRQLFKPTFTHLQPV